MSWGDLLACCERCPALSPSRECSLLTAPTPDNRNKLLTMPCNVQQLLAIRLKPQGEDVAREALVRWLDPSWDANDVLRSFGRAPRDARVWLTSWPYLYLGRNAVRRDARAAAELIGAGDVPEPERTFADPSLGLRVTRALDGVRRIDAVSHTMVLELMRDEFDPRAWATKLGVSEATVTDRKYLGVYRYFVIFHGVLGQIAPHEARVALAARRLSPGEPDDGRALAEARNTLGQPGLSLAAFRELVRDGAVQSLELLARPDALGAAYGDLSTAFKRVLKVS